MTSGDGSQSARRWWTAPAAIAGVAAAAVSIALARPSSFVAPRLPERLQLGMGHPGFRPTPAATRPIATAQAIHSAPNVGAAVQPVRAVVVTRPVLQATGFGQPSARTQQASSDQPATAASPAAPPQDPPSNWTESEPPDAPSSAATSSPAAGAGWGDGTTDAGDTEIQTPRNAAPASFSESGGGDR